MKKKGFTLIELLAVIVILAIIALITVPVVIKIINNSKKGAAEDSTYGIIESAKLFWASKQYDFGKNYSLVEFECDGTKVCSAKTPASFSGDLDISGTKPTGGIIRIQNGEVEVEDLEFGEYLCNTDSNYKVICEVSTTPRNVKITFDSNGGSSVDQVEIEKGSSLSSLPTSTKEGFDLVGWFTEINGGEALTTSTTINRTKTYYAHWQKSYSTGQVVYFDPVSENECNATKFNINNIKSGSSTCYKWYVISTGNDLKGESLKLILDHNIVNKVAWYSSRINTNGPYVVLNSLTNATTGWTRLDPINYTYITTGTNNYGTLSCVEGVCTMPGGTVGETAENGKKLRARLITRQELLAISNNSESNFPVWLKENTLGDYPNNYAGNNYGYWTLTQYSPKNEHAYYVQREGSFGYNNVDRADYIGARPVIVVPKSDLN